MSAFLKAIGSAVAGTYVTARLNLQLPASVNLSGSRLVWDLLDQDGRQWTQGEATDFAFAPSQTMPGQQTLSAEIQLGVPAQLPVNELGTQYQLRWNVVTQDQPIFTFENFTVLPNTQVTQGAIDTVELLGEPAYVEIALPKQYTVSVTAYRGNAKLFPARNVVHQHQAGDLYVYRSAIDVSEYISASLDPLSVVWSYGDSNTLTQKETTQAFIVTPVMLDAVKDLQTWLNSAYSNNGLAPGTTFDTTDFLKYLRMGRDRFNASGHPTDFSMTAAAGPIRNFWIGYATVAACRAQYLAEGMKAFDYSGQVVQLNVDRTPFWEATASALDMQLSEQVKPFKANLLKRGITGGDGSNMALRSGAVGAIGVTIHGLSPVRGIYGLNTPLNPYQR
jgi:hypothetical protein